MPLYSFFSECYEGCENCSNAACECVCGCLIKSGECCSACITGHLTFNEWAHSGQVEDFFCTTFLCTFPISIPLYTYTFLVGLMLAAGMICGHECCDSPDCCGLIKEDSNSAPSTTRSIVSEQPRYREPETITTTNFIEDYTQRSEAYEQARVDISFSEKDNPHVRQLMHSDDTAYRRAGRECFDTLANATNESEDIALRIQYFGESPELRKQQRKAAEAVWEAERIAKQCAKEEKHERKRASSLGY